VHDIDTLAPICLRVMLLLGLVALVMTVVDEVRRRRWDQSDVVSHIWKRRRRDKF